MASLYTDSEPTEPQSSFTEARSAIESSDGIGVDGLRQYTIKNTTYYVVDRDNPAPFDDWWKRTQFCLRNKARDPDKRFKPTWDRKVVRSDYWSYFEEIAESATGVVKIHCIRCGFVGGHPAVITERLDGSLGSRTGNSTMKAHLRSGNCMQKADNKGLTQLTFHDITDPRRKARVDRTRAAQFLEGQRVTSKHFLDCLARMIVSRGIPMNFFEDPEVQRSYLCLTTTEPPFSNPKSLRNRIFTLYESATKATRDDLAHPDSIKQKIGLAVDGWSAKSGRTGYLGILAYWTSTDMKWHEALLAFTPTEARHSGRDLAEMIMQTLLKFRITDRLRSITADNASSNGTMVASINDELKFLLSSHGSLDPVVSIPCISHVIQLVQGELLKGLKCVAENSEIIRNWDEKEFVREQRAIASYGAVPITLWKARQTAKHIVASEKRLRDFLKIQQELIDQEHPTLDKQELFWVSLLRQPLRPLQDVKTRWDSTTQMLVRLRILRQPLDRYWRQVSKQSMALDPQQWDIIEYLIDMTAPLNAFTQSIGRSSSPSIHRVYTIYDTTFGHLESTIDRLKKKHASWKISLKESLVNAVEKLKKYYSRTSVFTALDEAYAFSFLLSPRTRNTAFTSSAWKGRANNRGQNYRTVYMGRLRDHWEEHYKVDNPTQSEEGAAYTRGIDYVRQRLHQDVQPTEGSNSRSMDELARYFDSCSSNNIEPLEAWRENGNYIAYPTVARMARDYLCSPAASVGVERLFFLARCQSEFNREYKSETLEAIMVAKARLKLDFQIESERLQELEEELGDIGDADTSTLDTLVIESDTRKRHTNSILRATGEGEIHLISDGEDSEDDVEDDGRDSDPNTGEDRRDADQSDGLGEPDETLDELGEDYDTAGVAKRTRSSTMASEPQDRSKRNRL